MPLTISFGRNVEDKLLSINSNKQANLDELEKTEYVVDPIENGINANNPRYVVLKARSQSKFLISAEIGPRRPSSSSRAT